MKHLKPRIGLPVAWDLDAACGVASVGCINACGDVISHDTPPICPYNSPLLFQSHIDELHVAIVILTLISFVALLFLTLIPRHTAYGDTLLGLRRDKIWDATDLIYLLNTTLDQSAGSLASDYSSLLVAANPNSSC